MRRKALVLIIVLVGLNLTAAPPGGVIKGRVTDRASGAGLQGTNILFRRNQGTIALADGNYQLSVPPGKVALSFQHIGFRTVTHSLDVADKDTVIFNVELEYVVAEIDQVVVSAGRVDQRIAELSVSMHVIKPDMVTVKHVSEAKELINKTSGIEILDGQASVRGGSGFAYGAGSRVLALIDGLPVMSADAGNIRWQFLPLENISQIEIIKGASSVAYGSSALNGVINFRTADPSAEPVTRFHIESGLFGSPQNKNWKWWSTPRWYSNASVAHSQKFGPTGLNLGLNVLTDEGYRKLNDQKLGRLNLKVRHENQQIEGLSYGLSLNGGLTEKTDFVLWENGNTGALKQDESTAIELQSLFFTVDPFLVFHSGPSTRHDFRSRLQVSQNKFPESAQNNSSPSNLYAEYQYWHAFSEKVSFNTGISGNFSIINSNFYGDHNGMNAGAFAQFDINATSRMRFTAGVRVEQNWLDQEPDKIVPLFRAGFNYRTLDYTFLRASFGQGYRYPSIAEKYANTTLGSVRIFPSLFIQPEKGWNAEMGVKQGIMSPYFSGVIDIALFYSQYTDMIEFIFANYPVPGSTTYSFGFKADNVEAARVYGCELEFALTKNIGRFRNNLTGGYVWMYPAEFSPVTGKNSGNMLKYRRKHAATLNISTALNHFEVNIGLYAKSKIMRIDDVFLGETTRESLLPGFYDYWRTSNSGYILADASAGYRLNNRYTLSFMVKNLTNTEYMGRPGDIQPQRSYSLRLSGNF